MGSLSEAAEKRLAKVRRRPGAPEWFWPAGSLVLVVVVIYLAFTMVSGSGGVTTPVLRPAPDTAEAPAPTSGSTPSSTPTAPTSSDDGPTVEVATEDGEALAVPRTALTAAKAGATALFTGDFDGVTVAPDSTPPRLGDRYGVSAALTVGAVTVAEDTPGTYRFVVAIDPDGPGPAPWVAPAVTVTRSGPDWVVGFV